MTDAVRRRVRARVIFAGFLLVFPAAVVALYFVASVMGGRVPSLALYVLGSRDPVGLTADMLPWLVPASALTAIVGIALMLGRGIPAGIATAVAWAGLGIAGGRIEFAVAASIIAALLLTGRPDESRRAA